MKVRLDQLLIQKGLASSRRQAESLVMAGRVQVNGQKSEKIGRQVDIDSVIRVAEGSRYASRGGLKLESVADKLGLDFRNKTVLDVGASTGGFTDFALQHGAVKVYALDVGHGQLDWQLRNDPRVIVMEKTDIRSINELSEPVDIVLIDVSFISLQLVLPAVTKIVGSKTKIVAMVKPQFEAGVITASKYKGVIKNDTVRRGILKDFETWARPYFKIVAKADSEVTGMRGNRERFYLLKIK